MLVDSPDAFCRKLLAEGNPQELRAWLKGGRNTLGEMGTNAQSIAFANSLYAAGALHAYAVDIDRYPEAENTGHVIIELPGDPVLRGKVLDLAADISRRQGYGASEDVGQQYIYLMLD